MAEKSEGPNLAPAVKPVKPVTELPHLEEFEEDEHRLVGNETKFKGTPGYIAPHVETVRVRKVRRVG